MIDPTKRSACAFLDDTRMRTDDAAQDDTPSWPEIQARRQRWAELLQRIFEVEPLRCLRCGADMRIVAFVLDRDVIQAILRHLKKHSRDPRTYACKAGQTLARPPP